MLKDNTYFENEADENGLANINEKEANENGLANTVENEADGNGLANTAENEADDIELGKISEWSLEIKSLNINGPIKQMENEVPEAYIGHFKETSILGKNIALIAYNFGKDINYFANLKELNAGDEIIYKVNNTVKKYKVFSNQIIEKESLNSILMDNNYNEATLKLFTFVKDLDTKLRYICAYSHNINLND